MLNGAPGRKNIKKYLRPAVIPLKVTNKASITGLQIFYRYIKIMPTYSPLLFKFQTIYHIFYCYCIALLASHLYDVYCFY